MGSIPFLGAIFKTEDKNTVRNELLIMVTAHIIEGDELTTGEQVKTQDYQDYQPVTAESGLTAYEQVQKEKNYQEYPEFRKEEEEYHPTLRSFRDE